MTTVVSAVLVLDVILSHVLTWDASSIGNLIVYGLFYGQPGLDRAALLDSLFHVVPDAPWIGPWLLCLALAWGIPFVVLTGYSVIDRSRWAERYRVNRAEWLHPPLIRKAYQKLLLNRLRMSVETFLLFGGTGWMGGWSPERCALILSTLPSRWTQIYDLAMGLALFETMFYWIHRWEHRHFYAWHKEHHEFHSTLPIAAIWGSRVDALLTSILPFVLPMVVFRFHLTTCYMWMIIHYAHTWIDHSGYQLPFHPLQLVPYANHVLEHELHHRHCEGNYGLFWTTWDRWMGTHLPY